MSLTFLLAHYKPGSLQQRCDHADIRHIPDWPAPFSVSRPRSARLGFSGRLLLPVPIETLPGSLLSIHTSAGYSFEPCALPAADLVVDVYCARLFCSARRTPSTFFARHFLKKLASRLRRPSSPSRLATCASSLLDLPYLLVGCCRDRTLPICPQPFRLALPQVQHPSAHTQFRGQRPDVVTMLQTFQRVLLKPDGVLPIHPLRFFLHDTSPV